MGSWCPRLAQPPLLGSSRVPPVALRTWPEVCASLWTGPLPLLLRSQDKHRLEVAHIRSLVLSLCTMAGTGRGMGLPLMGTESTKGSFFVVSDWKRSFPCRHFWKRSLIPKEALSKLFLEFEPVRKTDGPKNVKDSRAVACSAASGSPVRFGAHPGTWLAGRLLTLVPEFVLSTEVCLGGPGHLPPSAAVC